MIMAIVLVAALATPALAAPGNILSDDYNIMVAEKGSKPKLSKQKVSKQKISKQKQPEPAPKYKSPRGTVQDVRAPKPKVVSPPRAIDPGYVYVPQTGRTFQNLPTPGGRTESFQDRAMRCTHQAGVYGQAGANRGAYMGGCL